MERRFTVKSMVVVEKAKKNYAADVPDLPGCIATGSTVEEVQTNIRSAVALHLEGLRRIDSQSLNRKHRPNSLKREFCL